MTDTSIYTDPTNMSKDNVQLSIWNGTKWVELSNGLTINQINANIGAVQDAVKDAQSGIAQATADAQNAVDTANDTATKVDGKVDDTTYQSGIAQLASDINLRVKSDDLLSQINIESGNILIQSNKIFLDASSVTFGGTAFITSAMVASLSADDIVTGTMTAGAINLGNGTFSVDTNGNLVATSASITGDITGSTITGSTITGSIIQGAEITTNADDYGYSIGLQGTQIYNNDNSISFSANQMAENSGMTLDSSYSINLVAESGNILASAPNGNFQITSGGFINTAGGTHLKNTQIDNELWVNGKLEANTFNGFIMSGNNIKTASTDLWVDSSGGSGGTATVHAKSFSQTSLLSKKTNITKLNTQDVINAINSTEIYEYNYKSDLEQGINKRYASYIIDDVNDVTQYNEPSAFLSEDKKGRDDGTQLAYLTLMVQEMYKTIQELNSSK